MESKPFSQHTLLVPMAGGPVFIPLCDRIPNPEHPKLQPALVQSDINAAINLGLRAVADPRLWAIHPRLRTQRESSGSLVAKEKRKYGVKKPPALSPAGDTKLPAEAGRVPNFFFDASAQINLPWAKATILDPQSGIQTPVVLGAAMWKTVRESQWERCRQINSARLAKWREKTAPANPDAIPM